jgi:CheY-like chemotaxis protein
MLALVVDDSMLIRHTVCRFLEARGFTVETATDGIAALEALKAIRPDLILTDLQMPRLSGYQLIDALKANEETADIPVLVLAAKPDAGKPLETRVHKFIYKDLNVERAAQPGSGKPLSTARYNLTLFTAEPSMLRRKNPCRQNSWPAV